MLLPIAFLLALWPIAASAADYTVQRGDSLWAISRRYNTTVKAIADANRITNPSLIRIGQRLYIPTGTSAMPAKPLAAPPSVNWLELSTVKPLPSTHYAVIHAWDQMTNYYAAYYKVDPDLIRRVMYVESRGYQYAKSSSGAMGLMQVMPFWFKAGEDPYNAWTNVGRGVYILRWSYDRWGSWEKACAGYLGGITRTGTITSAGNYYVSLIFNR